MHTNNVNARALMADAKFFEAYSRFDESLGRYETWNESVDRVMNTHRKFYEEKMTPELNELFEEASDAYKDKVVLGAQRALQFGGDQLLKNHMRMYNCFSRDTRFLTSTGIKSFNDFEHGDQTLVKTHMGRWQPAVVKSYGKQKLNRVTLKRRGSIVTVDVTANHRWILRGNKQTTSLSVGDQLVEFEDLSFSEFDWDSASVEEKLYWCYGLVYGDGTVTTSGQNQYSLIRLCGKDVRYVERFEEMGFKTSSNLSLQGDFFAYTGTYLKTLPSIEQDGINLVRAFARGLLDADGEKKQGWYDNKGRKFASITQSLDAKRGNETAAFIRDVFPAVGAWVVSENAYHAETNIKEYNGVRFVVNDNFVTSGTSGYWTVVSIEDLEREETVWCLEVEEDKSFILENGIPTGNCTSTYIDRDAVFGEIFWVLLAGAGCGFSVQKHHVAKLSNIQERKKTAKTFVVEDSVEGWADAASVLMSSFFVGGGTHPEYEGRKVYFDLSKIRPRGALISGGFKAPGPEPLRLALDKIEYLLQGRVLKGLVNIRPIDAYDIVMFIADAVLAGGVRRSATICLFSYDDDDMMNAKVGNWRQEHPHRARSNNSVVLVRDAITPEMFTNVFEKTKEFGEPGFAFFDSTEFNTNPCFEIGMYPKDIESGQSGFQGCNLTEINGDKMSSAEAFYKACRAAAIIGTIQAGYTTFKYLSEATKRIFEREALLGVSVTGWMNNPQILFDEDILRKGARIVKQVNRQVAKLLDINPAARTTCTKPSGNASVLLSTASGIHGEPAPKYLRIVQMNKDQEVAQLIKRFNPYMVEESVWSQSRTDYSIAFPVISPPNSIYNNQLLGVNLLEKVKLVQNVWVEEGTDVDLCVDPRLRHNVSNTVTVPNNGWENVEQYIYDNRDFLVGVSFISESGDKDYPQAPFTSVLEPEQIVEKYGAGAIFGAGLVTDALKVFSNLWEATTIAQNPHSQCQESLDNQIDWIRRFDKFARNYFDSDVKKAEYCLKDLYIAHKWQKIQQNYKSIDFVNDLKEKKYTEIDTMGAVACASGACEINF